MTGRTEMSDRAARTAESLLAIARRLRAGTITIEHAAERLDDEARTLTRPTLRETNWAAVEAGFAEMKGDA